VGGGDASDEFRYHARKQPESLPQCDAFSLAGRTADGANLLGRILSRAANVFVELRAEDTGSLGLAQVAILGLIVFFTFGRRSGPVMLPPVVSRLSPLEFVDTLGGLYERAGAEPAVVGFVYQRFRATLSRQLRLSSSASDAELADAVQGRLGWKESGLKSTMARALVASRAQKWHRTKHSA